MNFMEAVKAMKEGKKVRRPYFVEEHYFYCDEHGIKYSHSRKDKKWAEFSMDAFEATDWEIYEEDKLSEEDEEKILDDIKKKVDKATPEELDQAMKFFDDLEKKEDKWNLADKKKTSNSMTDNNEYFGEVYEYGDIKTFIAKVKEDIDKEDKTRFIGIKDFKEIIDKRAGDLK